MITMTNEAASLITTLVSDSDLPDSAGLRLGTDPFSGSLAMSLSRRPKASDVVVGHNGALLFLASTVADRLADQTLRAQLEDRPAFFLTA
jgi:hypothetical protein